MGGGTGKPTQLHPEASRTLALLETLVLPDNRHSH